MTRPLLRPVAPDALHLTLAFLGSRPPEDVDAIAPIVAREHAAPELALDKVLLLPPRHARVLTVALDDPTGALAALQSRVSSALEAAGVYTPEKRPFRPHVTVARLRPRTRPPRDATLHLDRRQFGATAVTLYASRVPVFWTSRAKSLYSAGFIVAGPVLSTVSSGVPGGIGGNTNSPTSPELLIVPPSLVMNSDTGLPLFRKLIDNV